MQPSAAIAVRWQELGLRGDMDGWLARCGLPLAAAIAQRAHGVCVIGVSGAQGSGKSSACELLLPLLARAHGLRALVLGLDDFYLPRAERARLAQAIHPLLCTRGVPGTHDVPLLARCLQALRDATDASEHSLPRFSKGDDERAPEPRREHGRFDVVLFEGWCVGAQPQNEAELLAPCNRLEAEEDPDARFRRYVNAQLAGPYRALFETLEALVFFAVPNMQSVYALRREQEAPLRKAGRGMSDEQLERFIAHFERITVSMLRDVPARADVLVQLDSTRHVTSIRAAKLQR